jgi:hypothetical protein
MPRELLPRRGCGRSCQLGSPGGCLHRQTRDSDRHGQHDQRAAASLRVGTPGDRRVPVCKADTMEPAKGEGTQAFRVNRIIGGMHILNKTTN